MGFRPPFNLPTFVPDDVLIEISNHLAWLSHQLNSSKFSVRISLSMFIYGFFRPEEAVIVCTFAVYKLTKDHVNT
jgi:hypothetical protein